MGVASGNHGCGICGLGVHESWQLGEDGERDGEFGLCLGWSFASAEQSERQNAGAWMLRTGDAECCLY